MNELLNESFDWFGHVLSNAVQAVEREREKELKFGVANGPWGVCEVLICHSA